MFNPFSTETSVDVTGSDSSDGVDDDSDEEPPMAVPPRDYDLAGAIERTIGNASSTCECCGDTVDGYDLDEFIICELNRVDFSDENLALVCRECHRYKDWEPRVRQNRHDQQINARLDRAIHWVSRDPIETLFLRRAAAGIALLLAATVLTTTITAFASGLRPLWNYLETTNFAIVGRAGLLGVAAGYWFHLHEREENDHRGTHIRECNFSDRPWSVLVFTTAGIALSTAIMILSPNTAVSVLGLSGYLGSAAIAFKNLESAVRADRCHRRVNWIPRYDRELYLLRMSIPTGFVFLLETITVGALVPAIAIGAYLVARKWYDLGSDWKLLSYGSGSGGDD